LAGSADVAGEGRRVLDPSSGQVYIVSLDLVPAASRALPGMFDEALHRFAMDEITSIRIEVEGRTREALVGGRQDPPHFWSWKEDAEHPSQELTSWADHVERLNARFPLPSPPEYEPALTITYFHNEERRGFLKLWACAPSGREMFCPSATEHTVGTVDLGPAGEQIIADASRMLSTTSPKMALPLPPQ
jgi:hypothetical protein